MNIGYFINKQYIEKSEGLKAFKSVQEKYMMSFDIYFYFFIDLSKVQLTFLLLEHILFI